MLEKVQIFFQESIKELKRVNWPSRQETIRYTAFVVFFAAGVALLLGVFDFIFLVFIEKIIS